MRNFLHISIIVILGSFFQACSEPAKSASSDTNSNLSLDPRVEELLAQMTLEEKVGQMTNISLMAVAEGDFWMRRDTVLLDTAKMRDLLANSHVGSVQNLGTYPFSPPEWRQNIGLLQDYVAENTRLKIPILYGIDAVHGANYTAGSTMLPQQLALAATWNTDLSEGAGRLTSYELRASGIPWNYAPVLDVSKQPLWGRIFETFGEDTYLVSEMGAAYIRGSQGADVSDDYQTAVCLKHFLGYGAAYNGKDRSPVYLPERMLRQTYLPPFQRAIEEGALTVMINSGAVNGTPSHADYKLLTTLLKEELNFQGFTISDWDDITNLVATHEVAKDEKEAIMLAVNAGMDMCMEPYDASFATFLVELVNEGKVPMSRVDDATRRILGVKMKLGLFDKVQSDPAIYPDFGSEKFAQENLDATLESITLLKNQNDILPLSKDSKVLVTGVAANSLNYLNGAWSRTWKGESTEFNDEGKLTILEGIQDLIGDNQVAFAEGTNYTEDINSNKAVSLARDVDYVIVCLGEMPATEKPSDIDNLEMPQAQLDLVHKLAETGKPIILVLVEARPRIIEEIELEVEAVVMAYLPGNEGGRAVSSIVFGDHNPSGKLPITYPKYAGSIWPYDHVKSDERDAGFGFDAFHPQYEFGFGLSYTSFAYSELTVSGDSIAMNETAKISVTITNTGDRAGKEAVQLYSRDLVASISPAVKQLRKFEKISLEPGESTTVNFELTEADLAFVNSENEWVTEAGDFTIQVDTLKTNFYLQQNDLD